MFTVACTYAQPVENTYCNNRFGFCVTYPEGVKLSEGQPINGDGILLENTEKDIIVNVSGSHNVMDWTPEKIYTFTREDFGMDMKAEVEVLESEVSNEGFEAILEAGGEIQHSRMWNIDDNYLVIAIHGPKDKKADIEKIWDGMLVDLHKEKQ